MERQLSPRREWSPALAKVKRDRNSVDKTKFLTNLVSLDDDDDDDFFKLPSAGDARKSLTSSLETSNKSPRRGKKPALPPSSSKIASSSTGKKGKAASSSAARARSNSPKPERKCRSKSPKKDRSVSPPPLSGVKSRPARHSYTSKHDNFKKEEPILPPEVQVKLDKLFDPNSTPLERVQIELEMNKDPVQREYLVNAKYKHNRKKTLNDADNYDMEKEQQMEHNIRKEAERAKQEQEEFEGKRQERIGEAQQRKARLAQAAEDAKKHAAAQRAKDYEDLRRTAEKTKQVQAQNIQKRQLEREAHAQYKEKALSNEESDVIRALKGAMIDQKEISKR